MKAMILAAGLGTRFKPWTDQHPKALALVNGKSLLERNIKYLQSFGIKEVLVNVHHFGEQIRDAIIANDGWGSNINISDETETVLETNGFSSVRLETRRKRQRARDGNESFIFRVSRFHR